ncbi:hypothetical protein HY29_15140 [Hyphomonas beringensis]|uniref:Diguanylate cyclase n=1 Tax=Hyphomonas beringensis TaxID=1280946 RepID=A0A062U955_9PROT|nr:bifunctional diguanylate cyclase/phosphodiesterase [Hyphomonas beringensis]KCZ54263.1 hypothetical protein HY29_15140 [Hyphomonas beringensis]
MISHNSKRLKLRGSVVQETSLLDATLTAISDAVVRVDERGAIEYLNNSASEMCGIEIDDAQGLPFEVAFKLVGQKDRPLELLKGFEGHQSLPAKLVTSRLVARDVQVSTERQYCPRGKPRGLLVVLRDVTDLKVSQIALAESEALFREALDHAPIGLLVIDGNKLISFANRVAGKITGLPVADLVGKPFADIGILNGLGAERIRACSQSEAEDEIGLTYEVSTPKGEGEEIRLRICIRHVRDGRGAVQHSIMRMEDVTAEYQHSEALHKANELAQVTISSASEGIVCTDENGLITLCNPVAMRLIGREKNDVLGRRFGDLFRLLSNREGDDTANWVDRVIARGQSVRFHSMLELVVAGDKKQPVNMSIAPMQSADGRPIGSVALLQDASDIIALTKKLRSQAYTDEMTGCHNRRSFEERLREKVNERERRNSKDFLLFLDLDHFKAINDLCGHRVGDNVLRDVSKMLRKNVRESDLVARIGGDEFGIILYDTDKVRARGVAERLVSEVSAFRLSHNERVFRIGVSIGMVEIQDQLDIETAMTQADTACYSAKNSGRGRVCDFEEVAEDVSETQESRSWYHRLLEAVEEKRIILFLQQIVSKGGRCVGYEALMRLREKGGIYSPCDFLENARRGGIIPVLDRVMFEHVIQVLRDEEKSALFGEGQYISVNLSASSIADPAFRNWLEDVLDQNIDLVERIWFELTESERMRWTPQEKAFLESLRARGARLFLDDFGTGYNSFEVLKIMNVDGLKLDHSVIKDVITSPVDQALVGAALGICRHLGLEIVAEGVETSATASFLASLGVHKFQGYYFHYPEEVSTVEAGYPYSGSVEKSVDVPAVG